MPSMGAYTPRMRSSLRLSLVGDVDDLLVQMSHLISSASRSTPPIDIHSALYAREHKTMTAK